jgi:hypothetical protein
MESKAWRGMKGESIQLEHALIWKKKEEREKQNIQVVKAKV